MRVKYIIIIFILVIVVSCKKEKEINPEVLKVPVSFDVVRFDQEFANASAEDLPKLKQKYPYLFPERYSDDFWVRKMQDTLQQEINEEVQKVFPDFDEQGQQLELLFKHIKYTFPEFKCPKVFTVTSEVDYRNKILVRDSIMFVALDTYLGENHVFYGGIAKFIAKNLKKEQLVTDVAMEYAEQLVPGSRDREFLSQMIYYGKLLYVVETFAPFISDAEKIGYTQSEFEWAQANESEMWRYFLENKLLYSTDSKLPSRFLNPAPFSKFQLELDNESPGMLGRYLGWQIVKSFMENNEVELRELIYETPETIFKQAKFKPRK